METNKNVSEDLLCELDPECTGETLRLRCFAVEPRTRVCLTGSNRWAQYERDFDSKEETERIYRTLEQVPVITKRVLASYRIKAA